MTTIDYPLSSWKFDSNVTNIFESHVRQSVPEYEEIQRLISHISDFFVKPNSVIYDLGCSTGETIHQINKRHINKQNHYIGVDNSSDMLSKALIKLRKCQYLELVNDSIEDFQFKHTSNFITCILTLQFIPIEKRSSVLSRIFNALNKGGAFILVEKVYPENAKIQEIFTQIYHDEKEQKGLSPTEIRDKDKSLRSVLNPLTAQENIELLHSVGFKTVEIFSKHLNFTGLIAIK